MYKYTPDPNVIQDTATGAFIPSSATNPEWLAYEEWALTNTPDPFLDSVAELALAKVNATNYANSQSAYYLDLWMGKPTSIVDYYKQQEATAYASDGSPDPLDYPFLSAIADSMGATLADTAAAVSTQMTEWMSNAMLIEGERMRLMAAIDAAADLSALSTVMASADWPTP